MIGRDSAFFGVSQTCAFVLAANFVMQGMRGMDNGELCFRILLEGAVASLVLALLPAAWPPSATLPLALVTAHLFNFTLNGQVFVCVRYCRFFRRSPDVLDEWLQKRVLRLKASGWLDEALCLGSKGTGERARSARSDIDLRLITPVGIAGWLRTNLLLLSLRSEAFFRAIPLDLYAYDRIESLKRFDGAEPLLIVLDRKGRLARTFAHRPLTRA